MKLELQTPPTPNREKFPFVATTKFKNLTIDLENLAGSVREGVDANGKKWKTEFSGVHYGEIRGSKGADDAPLDVFLKAEPEDTDLVFIVHQNHPGNHPTKAGLWDEDKVILGAKAIDEAEDLYLRHYNRKDFLRSITVMDFRKFKKYIFGENKEEKVATGSPQMNTNNLRVFYDIGIKLAFEVANLDKLAAMPPKIWYTKPVRSLVNKLKRVPHKGNKELLEDPRFLGKKPYYTPQDIYTQPRDIIVGRLSKAPHEGNPKLKKDRRFGGRSSKE